MNVYELTEVAVPAVTTGPRTADSWIKSPGFDLAFFILSPLIAMPVLLTARAEFDPVALIFVTLLGVPHYLSTFVFFFWDESRAEQRARWAVFFGGPALIVSTIACAAVFRIPYVIQVVVFVWNTFHVARQSCGILSIYRHRAGVKDRGVKPVVNSAVISISAAMAFWNIAWYPTLHRFMSLLWVGLPRTVSAITAAVAIVALARLAVSLRRRFQSDDPPGAPEMAFLATSLLLFHPYLWMRDTNRATLAMLVGHFVQYLGIVWLVQRRKFAAAGDPGSRTWLATLSTNLPLLLIALLMVGGLFLAVQVLSDGTRFVGALYQGGLISLALVHFYLDGLFWAFRRPDVRQRLGPYLMVKA
jgi:hypothetical protein